MHMSQQSYTDMLKPNLDSILQYYLQAGDIHFMNLLVVIELTIEIILIQLATNTCRSYHIAIYTAFLYFVIRFLTFPRDKTHR